MAITYSGAAKSGTFEASTPVGEPLLINAQEWAKQAGASYTAAERWRNATTPADSWDYTTPSASANMPESAIPGVGSRLVSGKYELYGTPTKAGRYRVKSQGYSGGWFAPNEGTLVVVGPAEPEPEPEPEPDPEPDPEPTDPEPEPSATVGEDRRVPVGQSITLHGHEWAALLGSAYSRGKSGWALFFPSLGPSAVTIPGMTGYTVPAKGAPVPVTGNMPVQMIQGAPTTAGEYTIPARYQEAGAGYGTGVTGTLTVYEPADPDPDPDPTDPEPTDPTDPTDPEPTDPEPTDPEPPEDDMALAPLYDKLAQRACRYIGRDPGTLDSPSEDFTTARQQVEIVVEFVRGYTRGHGFTLMAGEPEPRPNGALQVVIVSALSRLVQNPEQITYYSAADYAERGAMLNGWTLPERGILNNYRKVWA